MTAFPSVSLVLPGWVSELLDDPSREYRTAEERMGLAIELAQLNVEHETGGPFGAGVFAIETGRLVAPGVNLVVASRTPIAHAEMVALALAGTVRGDFDLGLGEPLELVASCEPCAMCYGALPWSGVRRLVCGARDADARAVGFDEGPKLADWRSQLEARGIEVVTDVRREQAASVLERYASSGYIIYNGTRGD